MSLDRWRSDFTFGLDRWSLESASIVGNGGWPRRVFRVGVDGLDIRLLFARLLFVRLLFTGVVFSVEGGPKGRLNLRPYLSCDRQSFERCAL